MRIIVIPHNFVWGSCFWFCIPGRLLLPASRLLPSIFHTQLCHTLSFIYNFVTHYLSHTTLSHTIFHRQLCHTPSFTHNFVTHYLSYTTLSHTIFHIQLCHTLSFTDNFVTHHLSHTTLSHTIFHIQLCHTPSFTYNFVTHYLSQTTLSHTIFHTQLCHTPFFTYNFVTHHLSQTTLSHTIFHRQLCHTPSFTHNFVTHHLSHTTLSHTIFHTQLCHTPSFTYNFVTHTPSFTHNFVTHHLSHTTLSHTIFHTHLCHTPSFTYNFVTHHLSHPPLSHTIFHIQLCHTPSFTYHIYRRFAWQAWHKLTSAALCVAGVAQTHIYRRFAWHLPSFCVAGVALMALGGALGLIWSPETARHFAWQAWHKLTSTIVLRGRSGTNSHLPSFGGRRGTDGTGWRAWSDLVARDATALCVASVAQTHIYHRFAWQAWHKLTSTIVWRGLPSFCVAGVAQTHICGTLRGRCGTNSHLPSFCVAFIYHRFAWQAWHWWHWVARLVWFVRPWRGGTFTSTIVLLGSRGTNSHLPSFGVVGVALMALGGALGLIWSPVTPRHFAWQAWHNVTSTFVLRGRRGTTHIYHRFAWQAWHWWHWAWSDLVARDAAALCVAGVAQCHIHVRFAWQAWHKLTSTIVLRGRRGTDGTGWRAWSDLVARDAAALCVAGVAQCHIHVRFARQAWHNQAWQLCHTHTYIHTFIHSYIRTRILSFHIPSCFVTHRLSHSTLSHTTVLPSRSFTTSFVFPSFPVPATTFEAQYWKKLTCGVIRSFNSFSLIIMVTHEFNCINIMITVVTVNHGY